MRLLLRSLTAGLAGLWVAQASAAPSPCEQAADTPRLLLHGQRGEQVPLGAAGAAHSRLSRSQVDWRGGEGPGGWRLGFGHEYSIFDISPTPGAAPAIEPSTNGHLHVLHGTLDASAWLPAGWRLRLQPALAVSSNFLKAPGEIGREAVQLNAGLARRFGGEDRGWRVGLCGDHRFGDWRVYPLVSWDWTSGPWSLRLGWPESRVARRFGEALESSVEVAPAGNRWRVLDRTIGDSRFVHQGWGLRWNLDWQAAPRWRLSLHLISLREGEYAFTLANGERFRGDSPAALQLGLSVAWRYTR